MLKKIINTCLILTAISMAAEGIFVLVKGVQKEKVTGYFRFFETKNNDTAVNWFALVWPYQIESQKIVYDTIHIDDSVSYPVAPKFQVVAPTDISKDTMVAQQIYKTIMDSIKKVHTSLLLDFDKQSLPVKTYANPQTISAKTNNFVISSMTGTASPEAALYGFEKSIQPNHIEKENIVLANNRLSRTKNILFRKLASKGVYVLKNPVFHVKELQLTSAQYDSVLHGHTEILDKMRYVKIEGYIVTERVAVTTFTTPVFLFLWIALIIWLSTRDYSWIGSLFRRGGTSSLHARKAIRGPHEWNLGDVAWIFLLLALLMYLFLWSILEAAVLFLFGLLLVTAMFLTWFFEGLSARGILNALRAFVLWIVSIIILFFRSLINAFRYYGRLRRECQIVVGSLFLCLLTIIFFSVAWATGYLQFVWK